MSSEMLERLKRTYENSLTQTHDDKEVSERLDKLRESRREELLKKAREDKETVDIVNFLVANKDKDLDMSILRELLAKVLPLRCAVAVAPRLSNKPDTSENFQNVLEQFSKMEIRLLFEVLEKMAVLMVGTSLETPNLESTLQALSFHQCSTCGQNDMVCCIL